MKYINIADIMLFIVLIAIVFFISRYNSNVDKNIITINTSHKSYRYTLDKDRILEIDGLHGVSVIEIKDGHVYFVSSPCPDKLCIKDGILKNKPLICMVNTIIVRYASSMDSANNQVDSIGY